MLNIHQIRENERECAIQYPASFWAVANELESLDATFPGFLVATPRDILRARELGLSEMLVPFAIDTQRGRFDDYYCCRSDGSSMVAVFAIHAVVAEWPDFRTFLSWVHSQRLKISHTEPVSSSTTLSQ